jgi:thiol-disulfide isomerase/thioredoxin
MGSAATAAVGIPAAAGLTPFTRRRTTPSWAGATDWLNSRKLTSDDLAGKVVVVDFWTFTCINWIRTAPYLRAWWDAYQDDGLVIIGVHTPEFTFEQDIDLIRRSIRDREIGYPVAVDNDYAIWRAFDNHYWPALYFLDRSGTIRHQHVGEVGYEQSEQLLQDLLGVDRDPVVVHGEGVEAVANWDALRTPETYLGYDRSAGFVSQPGPAGEVSSRYEIPHALSRNQWGLEGVWTVEREKIVLDRAGGSIHHRFHARDAHLVLSSARGEPVPFQVLLDGRPPAASHGVDVAADGMGVLLEGRLYQLVRNRDAVHDRTLEITFHAPGVSGYSLTFG